MKVHNPTEGTLDVIIAGNNYKVGPGETISKVPKERAEHWQKKLHPFIELSPDEAGEGEITDPEAVEKKAADDMVSELIGMDDDAKRRTKLEAIAEAAGIDPDKYEDDEDLAAAIREANSKEEEEDNEDEE